MYFNLKIFFFTNRLLYDADGNYKYICYIYNHFTRFS